MPSFSNSFLENLQIPPSMIRQIRVIGEQKGRQEIYRLQAAEKLENLRQVAVIQSVESSNRIEGVTAPPKRLEAIVRDKTSPKNRSEGEIAGYRDVLNTIHGSAQDVPFTEAVVLQFHRDLMKYGTGAGGVWKSTQNEIEETLPDGTKRVRFVPTPPHLTEGAMQSLHKDYRKSLTEEAHDPLILVPLYILDFLCIHPFLDGNGRMARLMTVLALYHHGYEVARYISLEKLIEQTKEGYYDTLYRASQGWHESDHDPLPWIDFWLSILLGAYRELETRMGAVTSSHATKTDIVITAIDQMIGPFSISELQKACPDVSRVWIKSVLDQLKRDNRLELTGKGRSARWRKTG